MNTKLIWLTLASLLGVASMVYFSCQHYKEESANPSQKNTALVISGIDFQKAESMASVLKGVNIVRGSQDVILTLDETRKLNIIDSSKRPFADVCFAIGVDGIRSSNDTSLCTRNEFIQILNRLMEAVKAGQYKQFYIGIHFEDDISGVEGLQLLQDICDSGVSGVLFWREENREERSLRLKIKRLPKPSAPSSQYNKSNKTEIPTASRAPVKFSDNLNH